MHPSIKIIAAFAVCLSIAVSPHIVAAKEPGAITIYDKVPQLLDSPQSAGLAGFGHCETTELQAFGDAHVTGNEWTFDGANDSLYSGAYGTAPLMQAHGAVYAYANDLDYTDIVGLAPYPGKCGCVYDYDIGVVLNRGEMYPIVNGLSTGSLVYNYVKDDKVGVAMMDSTHAYIIHNERVVYRFWIDAPTNDPQARSPITPRKLYPHFSMYHNGESMGEIHTCGLEYKEPETSGSIVVTPALPPITPDNGGPMVASVLMFLIALPFASLWARLSALGLLIFALGASLITGQVGFYYMYALALAGISIANFVWNFAHSESKS